MTDIVNLDDVMNSIAKDAKKIASSVAKGIAKKAQKKIVDEARNNVQKYYDSYSQRAYNRQYKLRRSIIPYYADKNTLENDDKKQLIKAFGLINDFMKDIIDGEKNNFQIILIEHADESYWEDLEYFHTAAKFSKSDNGGLIPNYIYE